ncbi:MAG: Fe-S cluster assembly protein SufD [Gemmatimonadota bacterium]
MASETGTDVLTPEGVTAQLNGDTVELSGSGDPEWLMERRRQAWEIYEQTPMPTTKLEEWRYTDLSKTLKLDSLEAVERNRRTVPPDQLPESVQQTMAADQAAAGRVVVLDGTVVHVDLSSELAAKGVKLASLRDAVERFPDLVRDHLAVAALPPEEGKFQALNAALWTDGVLLHVPRGVRLERPVRVTRHVSEAGKAVFSRTLIVADEASQVSFVEEVISPNLDAQSLVSSAVEIIAKDGAQLQYVGLQRMGRGAFALSQQRTLAYRDSTLDTLNVSLGASVARVDLHARLLGPGANSDMLGLYFGDDDQHFHHNTGQDHVAGNARSDLLYKGALDGKSRAVFRGVIKVHKGAQRTDAYQTNRNLLLSGSARADSLPNLEIEADDVRCSHGATVAELDAEHLFYLMSRGISRDIAERLVVMGFLGEVLSKLPLQGVVEKVSEAIRLKLRHG